MRQHSKSTDRMDELRSCFEAYGADLSHWPEERRVSLADLMTTDEAAVIRAEAEALDGFLNAATAPRMPEDLERRLSASYTAPEQRSGFSLAAVILASVRKRFLPAGILAGAGALGLLSGVVSASEQAPIAPETEALSYVQGGYLSQTLNGEEATLWDED